MLHQAVLAIAGYAAAALRLPFDHGEAGPRRRNGFAGKMRYRTYTRDDARARRNRIARWRKRKKAAK